jgi:DNA-directed RNA polymerase specialized sigma24 family protein
MLTTTALVLWKLIAVILVLFAVVDLLTMSQERKIRLHHGQGLSQESIAARLGISRYQVRQALAH